MDLLLECFSGISGNMFIGALLDMGVPFEHLEKEVKKLGLDGYQLIYKKVDKMGISSTYFNVKLEEHHHHHTDITLENSDVTFTEVHFEIEDLNHSHHHNEDHHHDNDNGYHEEYDHEDEEENHHLHYDHNHEPHHHHHHEHRNLKYIENIIKSSELSHYVKEKSLEIFSHIARAEAKIHGKSIDEVHFHEVGAIDSIIDAVGASVCMEYLGIEKVYADNIYKGNGFVNCAHGLFPVPAPATLEILNDTDFELKKSVVQSELITPTGAAILKTFAEPLRAPYKGIKTSYGSGTKDFEVPNVLRASEIELKKKKNRKEVFLIESNIDDSNGENLGYLLEILMERGALDVFYTPIFMKKNRPAYKISVISKKEDVKTLSKLIFKHSSSIGVRFTRYGRFEMNRRFEEIETKFGKIRKKLVEFEDIKKSSYEYEDLKKLAKENNLSLEELKDEIKWRNPLYSGFFTSYFYIGPQYDLKFLDQLCILVS